MHKTGQCCKCGKDKFVWLAWTMKQVQRAFFSFTFPRTRAGLEVVPMACIPYHANPWHLYHGMGIHSCVHADCIYVMS
jgi:hypothetical protein